MDEIIKDFKEIRLNDEERRELVEVLHDLEDDRMAGCPFYNCESCRTMFPEIVGTGLCPCESDVPAEIKIERVKLLLEINGVDYERKTKEKT